MCHVVSGKASGGLSRTGAQKAISRIQTFSKFLNRFFMRAILAMLEVCPGVFTDFQQTIWETTCLAV